MAIERVTAVLKTLSTKRPVFHSEADFQHAVAWEIHETFPQAKLRLETCVPRLEANQRLDLWVVMQGATIAFELKYATRKLGVCVDGERYSLKNQAAQDLLRHDFAKDLMRVEQVSAANEGVSGACIFLTNDSSYWKRSQKHLPIDNAFRLHEGAMLSGKLCWEEGASEGTKKGREGPICLLGSYPISWRDYSRLEGKYSQFRYLLLEANHSGEAPASQVI